jgi:hypothetical protein
MKRILCLLLVLLVIPVSSAFAAKTERVEAFGFYGLYVKRMMEYQTIYGGDYEFRVEGLNYPIQFGKEIEVNTAAADFTIDLDDFKIKEAMIIIFMSDSTSKENLFRNISACVAMSALEYSERKENIMKLQYKAGIGRAPSAIQLMVELFATEIQEKIDKAISQKSPNRILVYSGNYDYYISYFVPSSAPVEMVYLIAEAK